MHYDTIIVEMLSRIQALEEKVALLSQSDKVQVMRSDKVQVTRSYTSGIKPTEKKTTTSIVKDYINEQIRLAASEGKEYIVLRASKIHNELNLAKRTGRHRLVCEAMYQCMREGDCILYKPPKGYSSAVEIKYFCAGRE